MRLDPKLTMPFLSFKNSRNPKYSSAELASLTVRSIRPRLDQSKQFRVKVVISVVIATGGKLIIAG